MTARLRNGIGIGLFLGLFLCSMLPNAVFAQGFGSIGGTLTDESGGVIPGVTITLSNPGTIGGNQEAVTDARGMYRFSRLVPGTYSIRAQLVGFQSAVRENVLVNADATARVDLELTPGAVEETITVSGLAPLVDTSTVLTQTVLTREAVDLLPSRNDPWTIARVVPGVLMNKYDVGGTEAFGQSIVSVHGSMRNENVYMIDGMNIGDARGNGYTVAYVDPFMYQEINYQTANASAENQRGGVLYNLITKTGTNTFRGSFMFTGSNDNLQSNNVSQALRNQLLAGVPARALAANPDLVPGAKVLRMFDAGATFSGPVVRNRMWFTSAVKYGVLDQLRVGSYNADGTQFVDDNRMKNASFKVSWQAARSSQLHYTFNRNWKGAFHYTGNEPVDFRDSLATWRQDQKINIHQLRATTTLSPRTVLDIAGSLQIGPNPFSEQPEINPGDIPRFDSVTRTHTVANTTYQFNPRHRGVLQSSLSHVAGSHDIKFGYQFTRLYARQQVHSTSHYPSGLRAVYRNGVPDSVNTYNTPVDYAAMNHEHAVYVQDKWTPLSRVTLNLGVRLDTSSGKMPAACQPETPFIQAQCFPATEDVLSWVDLAPRFGFVYDVSGNGTTALKVSVNRYLNGYGPEDTLRVNPLSVTSDTRQWSDLNGDDIPQLTELGPSTGFNLGTTNRFSDTAKRPRTNELSVGIQHQLPVELVVTLAYYHRQTRENIGARNLAVPSSSYRPIDVTEATSGRQVTVYDQDPGLRGQFDVLWDNSRELDTNYNGVDVTFNRRMTSRWMMVGGVSLGKNYGYIYSESADLNNPNFTFRTGVVGSDVPVAFKAMAAYQFPYGLLVSGTGQHFTGFPENTTVLISRNSVSLTQVSQSLLVEPRGSTRLPTVNVVDLSVRKGLAMRGVKAEAVLDVFNVTNGNAIQSRTTQLGPTYGNVAAILRGRLMRLGVNLNF